LGSWVRLVWGEGAWGSGLVVALVLGHGPEDADEVAAEGAQRLVVLFAFGPFAVVSHSATCAMWQASASSGAPLWRWPGAACWERAVRLRTAGCAQWRRVPVWLAANGHRARCVGRAVYG